MLKITAVGDNRLDIDFSGKVDSDDMRKALDDFVAKSSAIEHGRLLYRIGEFEFPSLGAIGVELSRLPELFRLVKKFDRAAVLADQRWIKVISEFKSALMPGLVIKSFDPDQSAQAELWLNG